MLSDASVSLPGGLGTFDEGGDGLIGTVWGRGYTMREPGLDQSATDALGGGKRTIIPESPAERFIDDGGRPLISPIRAAAILLGRLTDEDCKRVKEEDESAGNVVRLNAATKIESVA